MTSQLGPEKIPSCRDGGGAVIHDCLGVEQPQRMEDNSMPRLKTKPVAPAKDQRIGRPGEGSLLKSDCVREGKEGTKILPETLCQGTGKDEVAQGLRLARTEMTTRCPRFKRTNAITQGKSVEEKFVVRLLLTRGTSFGMETVPDIWRRGANVGDAPGLPIERSQKALSAAKIRAGQGGCERE